VRPDLVVVLPPDQAGKKITLKHGPLENRDMPAMTMAFQVSDPDMLGKVKVSDKVRFVAANPVAS
jgi:Cu(I)/Ag(I) efflux system protein CusF